MHPLKEERFLKVNLITIISLFLLILAGGIVRISGSGMGCPDWPKCFDQYIPPTKISQLPADYKERYIAKRVQKNNRFAEMLGNLGYGETAYKIRNDQSILKPDEFNVFKTYTEYLNRLIGVVFGFLVLALAVLSLHYLKRRKSIFILCICNLILVGFQGWLGSIVVSTNLLAWVVTVHMLLALVILALLITTYFKAKTSRNRNILIRHPSKSIRALTFLIVTLSIVQIALGTTVREQLDSIADAMNHLNRSEWISNSGLAFILHRDFAIVVLIANVAVFLMIRKRFALDGLQFRYASINILFIGLQFITGFTLSYLALPPVAQAVHLVLASLLFGGQYYLFLLLSKNRYIHKKSIK
jgi:cytochrome c oxidase assembly protein subunit 15